ncbi:MAG: amidase [Solirubrobacteraceae bacterium]
MLEELAFEDATALADLVRAREVSSAELVQATIERIEALNPQLNAVVTPMYEEGLECARLADAARPRASRSGRQRSGPPFAGVPFLVKDLIATCAGVRQTEGSRFCAERRATVDSELVRRLRASGVVIVGKTNTSELGSTPVTEGSMFGATRNPWDPSLSPAGSSGGSAVAVASGIVPMAHGNDTGGSLRNPASACGVFGFKPSRGRMPLDPAHGELLSRLLVEHALTRSVRDSARLLDATHGALPGDPYRAPAPEQPFSRASEAEQGRLRIAFSTRTPTGERPHEECVACVERAAHLCEQLGYEVVEAEPQLDGGALVDAWFEIWAQTIGGMMDRLAGATGRQLVREDFEPLTWRWHERGASRSAAQYLEAARTLTRCAAAIEEFLGDCDVWLTPTLGTPAIPVGVFAALAAQDGSANGREQDVSKYMGFSPFARLANITGFPAMSVPLHWTPDGVPVGAHFMGRRWGEHTLLALAARLERAAPWGAMRPPVSVGATV